MINPGYSEEEIKVINSTLNVTVNKINKNTVEFLKDGIDYFLTTDVINDMVYYKIFISKVYKNKYLKLEDLLSKNFK